ncbi:PQQ-dependent sugar dehydrogenase [Hymenobacter aerilatus]|uniref:PQQ-dependent sugar dehydrogenase n=1 Tax=Hymenobacter aerilatus TaxID=2932251 RepID=A0A8T9SUS8_9BACT|nr:PQQ-dependent sugar dehydrogenase [Hymenobacter aerilatus]UOR05635.1 PQQ-dependent sugar dehydrogenase [Hymenobacter aerilatus]
MFRLFLYLCLLVSYLSTYAQTTFIGPQGEKFTRRIVAKGLSDPWEVTYGPDQYLWITEARGYRVSRINPANGAKTVLLDLHNAKNFPRYDKIPDSLDGGKPWPQGGLMGMALHPQLLQGKPYVYLVYIYHFAGAAEKGKGSKPNYGGSFFTAKLVRYEYNRQAQTLGKPVTLCDTLPSSNDHTAGRLLIAPVEGKDYLFLTTGDLGAGQFSNGGRPNHAQEINRYEGKVLRFNLEPDTDPTPTDQWIPNDNPFMGAQQNAVWSYGHRNPQGLDYAEIGGTGRLYSSEHGPYSDDEINLIEKGKNYGHPLVLGYADGNYNGLAAGVSNHDSLPGRWHTTYPTIDSERANAAAIGAATYRDPIKTLYPSSAAFLQKLYRNEQRPKPEKMQWSSEAPSSLAVYTATSIPGWQNSLLIPGLKHGKLIRLKLNAAGDGISGDTLMYFQAPARYRDVALSPDGRKIYLALDSAAISSGPSKKDPKKAAVSGCILEFTYRSGGTPVGEADKPKRTR